MSVHHVTIAHPSPKRPALHRTSRNGLTIVLKLGTSSICDEKTHRPLLANLSLVVETIIKLRELGHRVILVTSGAVGMGLRRLNMPTKPTEIAKKQAVAAVGQGRLMSLYDDLFSQFNQPIAQVLLTRNDLADRTQYLNACNTFEQLLEMDVIPIVNENDTISVAEIKFGDNDTLSAITAGMVNADYLFLLTDVDCLYTDNPRTNPDAKPIRFVENITELREKVIVSSPGSALGTGGMVTKLTAAELATAAGVTTFIARGSTPQNILQILEEVTVCNSRMATPTRSRPHTPTRSRPHSPVDRQDASSVLSSPHPTVHINSTHPNLLYTCFLAEKTPLRDRKWWIKHGIHTAGTLVVDQGAVHAIFRYKASLFAAGIVEVKGHFVAQQGVRVVFAYRDAASKDNTIQYLEVGHGLVNYSSAEIQRIRGRSSAEIQEILGYAYADCVIHRQNLSRTMTHEEWKRWASEHLA